jgi:hypothetical protein
MQGNFSYHTLTYKSALHLHQPNYRKHTESFHNIMSELLNYTPSLVRLLTIVAMEDAESTLAPHMLGLHGLEHRDTHTIATLFGVVQRVFPPTLSGSTWGRVTTLIPLIRAFSMKVLERIGGTEKYTSIHDNWQDVIEMSEPRSRATAGDYIRSVSPYIERIFAHLLYEMVYVDGDVVDRADVFLGGQGRIWLFQAASCDTTPMY